MNRKFDFSEIDGALPDAEKMQERERMTEALEENCKVVRVLCDRMERLEARLSETLPIVDGAVFSLQQAGRVTVSEESRQALEREGDAICRKMAGRMESECSKLVGRLSAGNRVIVSPTAFWCMIEALIFLAAAFICICAANAHLLHSVWLWKLLGCIVVFLAVCIALTLLVCHKLK